MGDMENLKNSNKALELFTHLLGFPSPPGHEHRIAGAITSKLEDLDVAYEQDAAGNITVVLPAAKPTRSTSGGLTPVLTILAAHMDEIAMVVSKIEENGELKAVRSGGLYPAKLGEGPVMLLGDQEDVVGILSFGSMHRTDAADLAVTWDNARIITGHDPLALASFGVGVGTPAVPTFERRGPVVHGPENDPLVSAWTFDDRMGVVALLRLIEEMKATKATAVRPTVVAFTVHEEGGCHGAKLLARKLGPEAFIAVDGCPIPPDADLSIDGRPGIWYKDTHIQYSRSLIRELTEAATAAGVELQRAVYAGAASDASAVYAAGFADRVATIGHVRENSHGYEVARLSVFERLFEVLKSYVLG